MKSWATMWGRGCLHRALPVLLMCVCGCAGLVDGPVAARVEAPAWEHTAFTSGDADFVGAVDLRALRTDPVFGPLLRELARKEDLGVLARASQIDVLASVERGEPASWLVVAHDVDGAPGRKDLGSSAGDTVVTPGAWILGEGEAFARVRANPALASSRVAMPARALVVSSAKGRAFPRPKHPVFADMTEGLEEATVELLGGAHLEVGMRCRYADTTAARHAAAAARVALLAEAARNDAYALLARALVQVDFDVTGEVVSLRLRISDDLRDVLQSYVERALR